MGCTRSLPSSARRTWKSQAVELLIPCSATNMPCWQGLIAGFPRHGVSAWSPCSPRFRDCSEARLSKEHFSLLTGFIGFIRKQCARTTKMMRGQAQWRSHATPAKPSESREVDPARRDTGDISLFLRRLQHFTWSLHGMLSLHISDRHARGMLKSSCTKAGSPKAIFCRSAMPLSRPRNYIRQRSCPHHRCAGA